VKLKGLMLLLKLLLHACKYMFTTGGNLPIVPCPYSPTTVSTRVARPNYFDTAPTPGTNLDIQINVKSKKL
jgi:hypothetical protein